MLDDVLIIEGIPIKSRLFIGSGKYSSNALIPEIVDKSGTQVITVAVSIWNQKKKIC